MFPTPQGRDDVAFSLSRSRSVVRRKISLCIETRNTQTGYTKQMLQRTASYEEISSLSTGAAEFLIFFQSSNGHLQEPDPRALASDFKFAHATGSVSMKSTISILYWLELRSGSDLQYNTMHMTSMPTGERQNVCNLR